jgi:hypothetical protein
MTFLSLTHTESNRHLEAQHLLCYVKTLTMFFSNVFFETMGCST